MTPNSSIYRRQWKPLKRVKNDVTIIYILKQDQQGAAHHVVRCADEGGGHIKGWAKDARNAKVPELDQAGTRQEDVLSLEITVKDVVAVQVLWVEEKENVGEVAAKEKDNNT